MGTPGNTDTLEQSTNVDYEKRFKDTQAYATKIAQEKAEKERELNELKAEISVLKEAAKPSLLIDEAMQNELEELKFSDPEAWRDKLNRLEKDANKSFTSKIEEAKKTVSLQQELERRASILSNFQKEHPDVQLTDELLQFDIPLRITKKLEAGKISYEEFLNEAYNYVKTPKVIGSVNTTLDQPNLSKVGGDDTPTVISADSRNVKQIYENMEF